MIIEIQYGRIVEHHYLPQFYIKGFCDENGTITVYNKQYKKFERKLLNIFFLKRIEILF